MTEGGMLKKITEAMKDLVTEANFDCSTTGISLQAMVRARTLPHAWHCASPVIPHTFMSTDVAHSSRAPSPGF